MADAGIDDPKDVHFVQINCPLLTSERIEAAHARGQKDRNHQRVRIDGLLARRLGPRRCLDLGEVGGAIRDEQILKDWNLFSSVASTSAGIELMHNVVIVLAIRTRRPAPS